MPATAPLIITFMVKVSDLTNTKTGSICDSNNTPSSARQQQPRIVIRNMKAGDWSHQYFEAKEGSSISDISAGKNSVQAFGSKDIIQIASGLPTTQNIESPDADDSTDQLMDECASAYARC